MLSIESSLWPLIVWMRALGFHTGPAKSGPRYSVCLLTTGVFMVLSTVALHCTSFVHDVLRLRANGIGPNGTNLSTANIINIGIEHMNFTCIHIGVHSAFFFITLTATWNDLWNTFALIEERLNFKPKFYAKCRKSLLVGFFLLFLVINANNCVSFSYNSQLDYLT